MATPKHFAAIVGILSFAFCISVSAADLLIHDGFETCWVTAKTKPQFLESIRSSIDGTSACIPAQSGSQTGINYTVCAAVNGCGAGVDGCPVSISAGTFSGNFVAGHFAAPGTAANVTVPITTSVFPACSISLNTITLGYTLDYLMQTDGVDGVYSIDLMTPGVAITNYALTNIDCNGTLFALISGNVASAITAAEANASATIEPGLRADTLEQSVCPLSAP
jgi:ferredoxin